MKNTDTKVVFDTIDSNFKISATFLILVVLYITFTLTANATFAKAIEIGRFVGVGGAVVMPLVYLLEDVIAEIYGYKISRTLLWLAMFSELVFSGCILIIIHIKSPSFWMYQQDFNVVFDKLLQVGPVAIVAVLAGQFANIYIVTKFKVLLKGKYFWLRSIFASSLGGGIVAALYFAGFWKIYPFADLLQMFTSDFLLRVAYAIVGGFPAMILVAALKKIEGMDVYDVGTNFNPFKLSLKD